MSNQKNDQNNNRGSATGFSRFARNNQQNNNQNNQQNNNNNQKNNNPLLSRAKNASSSRFGRNNNNQKNNNRSASRFGGVPSRFGSSEVVWEISPLSEPFVRFNLDGLGDPFHRLLGANINLNYSNASELTKALAQGGGTVDALIEQMDAAWQTYDMKGAMLVYPWKDHSKQIIAAKPEQPNNQSSQNDNNDDEYYDDEEDTAENPKRKTACLRSIDMLLVLNVLARTRADLLLANAPLTLDVGFMERSLVTNEPRLIALARATGCVEEHFN